ncbi:nucleotidyltransferase substrate binding protein [Rudanella lutea]|uniref:nucleotidyltransferase substrate binding protein n=1 Tax=Rudanella lutea TaxID=451374 RepID=UPI00036D9CDF
MTNGPDSRWEQRFSNYKRAVNRLGAVASLDAVATFSELEKDGVIQRFKYSYELAWRTLQAICTHEKYSQTPSPVSIFRLAQQKGYFGSEAEWTQLMRSRALVASAYESSIAHNLVLDIVTLNYPLLKQLEHRIGQSQQ